MRVITGVAKGRPLKTVKNRDIRPTADRVKESLFNVLGSRVAGSDFLDLFAGSGAVGIEALSRGAESCVFVDLVTGHLQVVQENLTSTGLAGHAELLRRDARAAVADLGHRGRQFDIIFVDPPYGRDLVPLAMTALAEHKLCRPDGLIICEHHRKDPVTDHYPDAVAAGGLTKFRELVFGETVLSLYSEATGDSGGQTV